MMSKILTGLNDQEWLLAYGQARQAMVKPGDRLIPEPDSIQFSKWKQAVKDEARNRQNISFCISGVRISYKAAIRQVIDEVTKPAAEVRRG